MGRYRGFDMAMESPQWTQMIFPAHQWSFNDHKCTICCTSIVSFRDFPAMLRPRSRICSRTLSAGPLRSSWPWRCQTCTSLPPGATTLWVLKDLKGEPMHQEKVETVGCFFEEDMLGIAGNLEWPGMTWWFLKKSYFFGGDMGEPKIIQTYPKHGGIHNGNRWFRGATPF